MLFCNTLRNVIYINLRRINCTANYNSLYQPHSQCLLIIIILFYIYFGLEYNNNN